MNLIQPTFIVVILTLVYSFVNNFFLDRTPHPMEYLPIGMIVGEIFLRRRK